jgi:hypothetical protein
MMLPSLSQLDAALAHWESDKTVLESAHFASRMAILDELDPYLSDPAALPARDLLGRARTLATKIESINNEFFKSIRHQIQNGTRPEEFTAILRHLTTPPRGLAYDYLDDLLAGVFQFEPPSEEPRPLASDSVFYQPTPARHIFHLITAASITRDDTAIDVGSGLGHVPLLTSICTGATSIAVELDPAWNASATRCATALNLSNVSFLTQDAREADLSSGTVFYLYTPFIGSTLASVLDSLRIQASQRPIRICTFGPCTIAVTNQPWLNPATPPVIDQITVFIPTA